MAVTANDDRSGGGSGERGTRARLLSLSPLTVLPCSPLEQIEAAEAAGFDAVDLRLVPVLDTDVDVMADAPLRRAIVRRLQESGLVVLGVEVVRIGPTTDVRALEPMLDYAGEVGARCMTVTAPAKADWRPEDEPETVRRLALLCELAAARNIRPMIEFMVFRGIATLEDAVRVARSVGHPNIGICLDALHLMRSGGTPASVSRVDPAMLACLQLCDAPLEPPADLPHEARFGRVYPGEGALPLREIVRAVPADLPIALEAPNVAYRGLSPVARSRRIAACTQAVLDA
jgi:sugar phosphate isomerase/epimerase